MIRYHMVLSGFFYITNNAITPKIGEAGHLIIQTYKPDIFKLFIYNKTTKSVIFKLDQSGNIYEVMIY